MQSPAEIFNKDINTIQELDSAIQSFKKLNFLDYPILLMQKIFSNNSFHLLSRLYNSMKENPALYTRNKYYYTNMAFMNGDMETVGICSSLFPEVEYDEHILFLAMKTQRNDFVEKFDFIIDKSKTIYVCIDILMSMCQLLENYKIFYLSMAILKGYVKINELKTLNLESIESEMVRDTLRSIMWIDMNLESLLKL